MAAMAAYHTNSRPNEAEVGHYCHQSHDILLKLAVMHATRFLEETPAQ